MKGFGVGCALSVGIALLAGCSKSSPDTSSIQEVSESAPTSNPADDLYEKLHAGAFQLDSALDSLEEARGAVRSILPDQGGDTKEALLDLLDTLDSAGGTVGEYNAAPDPAEVNRDPNAARQRLQRAIDEANDAVRDLREARGTLADMLDSEPPAKEKAALEKADDSVEEAVEAISEGIRLFGGKVSAEEDAGSGGR